MERAVSALLLLPLALAAAGASGCASADESADPHAVTWARTRAEEAAAELMQTLMRRLTGALAEGGPEQAIRVCADVAQDLTAEIGERRGLVIRRTALRWRNPANAPDAWEKAWMDRAVAAKEKVVPTAEVVTAPDGRRELRYARPIFVMKTCLQCHGAADELDPGVRRVLAERYPEDHATGFRAGDFRGIVSVRVPLAGGAGS